MSEGIEQTLTTAEAPRHELGDALWTALKAYSKDIAHTRAKPYHDPESLEEITNEFYELADGLSTYGMPRETIEQISLRFIDHALDFSTPTPRHERIASANLALNLGRDVVDDTKVAYLQDRYQAFIDPKTGNERAANLAESMLSTLGYEYDPEQLTSYAQDAARITRELTGGFVKVAREKGETLVTVIQEHKKTAVMAGTAAVTAAMLMAPSAANAAEAPKVSASSMILAAPESKAPNAQTTSAKIKESATPENVTMILGDSIENLTKAAKATAITSAEPQETTVSAKSMILSGEKTKNAQPVAITTPATTEETPKDVSMVMAVTAPEATLAGNGKASATPEATALTSAPTVTTSPEAADGKPLSNEDKTAQFVQSLINNNGDIQTASALIESTFRSELNKDADGNAIYATANDQLVETLRGLESSLTATVTSNGHSDANYNNTAYMAMAVIDAAAHDHTVLDSDYVKNLVASATRSNDEYSGKLFDKDMDTAKQTLEADNGTRLSDFSDSDKTQFELLYTYVLMATSSDSDQQNQIQGIKQAEADAEAAAKASETNNNGSAEDEALTNLINTHTGVDQRKWQIYKYFIDHGYSREQSAGILGNLFKESGSTLDPTILQGFGHATNMYPSPDSIDYRTGHAQGLVEWEQGRLRGLIQYAWDKKVSPYDLNVQLDYIMVELNGGESAANAAIKATNTPFDAAYAWMTKYERPAVQTHAEAQDRLNRVGNLLGEYDDAVKSVNDARAEAARKAAEQAEQKANGMTLDQAKAFFHEYQSDPTSVNYIGLAGHNCDGGPLSNCVSFSNYFVNKYTNLGGMLDKLPGNGSEVADTIAARNPQVKVDTTPTPDSVFSIASGLQYCGKTKCGHTGVVLGINKDNDQIIVGEAACDAVGVEWDGVHVYSLSAWSNGEHEYAHVGDFLKTALQ